MNKLISVDLVLYTQWRSRPFEVRFFQIKESEEEEQTDWMFYKFNHIIILYLDIAY